MEQELLPVPVPILPRPVLACPAGSKPKERSMSRKCETCLFNLLLMLLILPTSCDPREKALTV